jgi:hypothetical protein
MLWSMDILEQYRSLALEFKGVKNRVLNLIGDAHWLSDGEWKESILRSTLRDSLPRDMNIGRGFVSTLDVLSNQIDVLISPSSTPALFRDGDFTVVSPSGLLGALEVKTTATAANFTEAVRNLIGLAELVGIRFTRTNPQRHRFYGFFAYNSKLSINTALEILQREAHHNSDFAIDFICLGPRIFIRWFGGGEVRRADEEEWRAYHFPDDWAFDYFLHNVIEATCPHMGEEDRGIWYPVERKEGYQVAQLRLLAQ